MKKWIAAILMVIFAAGISVADETAAADGPKSEKRERRQERRRPRLSEEQRAAMKAHYEKVQNLSEAARAEADPAKKAELVEQLRAVLTEGAQRMQAQFRKRIEKAEQDLMKMKERLAEGETQMEQRVEEHLQRLLSGEKPERRGGSKQGKGSKAPPAE